MLLLSLLLSIAAPNQALADNLPARAFIQDLSALGDRALGAKGNARAADYLEERLRELAGTGAVIGRHRLFEPVPVHLRAKLTRLGNGEAGHSITIAPLLMNALSTGAIPSPGLEAPLLYTGQGDLVDFNGLDPKGAVVLMDLNSGRNWLNAAMLGARAVIYLDTEDHSAPRRFFTDKWEQTPVDFPRFYLTRAEAEALLGPLPRNPAQLTDGGTPLRVRLTCKTVWKNAGADNIHCLIPGTDPALDQELLVVQAFYDTESFVPGRSPGADQAASVAALLQFAAELGANPPARPVLLLATPGQARAVAGMRHFVWLLNTEREQIEAMAQECEERSDRAGRSVELLSRDLIPHDLGLEQEAIISEQDLLLLRQALKKAITARLDHINTVLMRLRLERRPEDKPRIRALADERMLLKGLIWPDSPYLALNQVPDAEREVLLRFQEPALALQQAAYEDAAGRLVSLRQGLELLDLIGGREIKALAGLHLSSHGDGVGGFDKGWLYDLDQDVNRTRLLSNVDGLLKETAGESEHGDLFQDTLRPSHLRTWRSYLPDQPHLGAEPAALAGLPAFTLATTHDARPFLGSPQDTVERVDFDFLERQNRLVVSLLSTLARKPLPDPGAEGKDGFATLKARANLLRPGQVFADKPASGSVFLVYQGWTRFYAWVDTRGEFLLPGLITKKQTVHKAILEGFNFEPETGRARWAVDKPTTGKDAYRVKMRRKDMETDLIMFPCAQTTFFSMLEPRTFRFLYMPELIDSRTESEPLRFWYSRLDTGLSTLGTFFLEPDLPLKLTLSDTVLGRKMVLLNNDEDMPEGRGYRVGDWPVVDRTEYRAAKDMWTLLGPRILNLEKRGIVNQRLRDLRIKGQKALARAEEHLENKQWDGFLDESRDALAVASHVYNAVNKTQRDVLVGVLFYIALFVPFAYCLERLLFGFTSIHKRIVGFLGLLTATIAVIYNVHPAFRLTYSPMVVILAFFILGLSFLVSMIIFMRFEKEMKDLQRRAMHAKTSDVSRVQAFRAAFALGVSNLRRRPLRTGLTCATLIILTFTIMNFTAVKSVRQHGWTAFSDQASYQGLLMKQVGWQDIQPEGLQILRDKYRDRALVAPRYWFETKDKTRAAVIPLRMGENTTQAQGLVGLSHTEPGVSGLDQALVAGRWFGPDEPYALILPQTLAESLGVDLNTPGRDIVEFWGVDFTVTGIMRDNGLSSLHDLDGEPVTPIVYPSEADTQLSEVEAAAIAKGEDVVLYEGRYEHVPGAQTMIIPADTLNNLAGQNGRLKAVAVKPLPGEEASALGDDIGDRFGLLLFRGGPEGASLYFTSESFSYSGMSTVLIPLLITMLIVLNTMIASVYERRGEIAIYTSVGLAPSHVSFLFVAEALAFAAISTVAGYLLAQTTAALLAGTSLWQGMTANYSSMAGVGAMFLVIGVVLLSVIYPSRVAARIAIPDVARSWTMPKAEGDTLALTLPFLVKAHEQLCTGGFLLKYYMAHHDVTHGMFSTGDLQCGFVDEQSALACTMPDASGNNLAQNMPQADPEQDNACLTLNMRIWLAPFDFGVRQRLTLVFCPSESYEGFRRIRVHIRREAGEHVAWQNLNKNFLHDLRKQLLLWRSLDQEAKEVFARSCLLAVNSKDKKEGSHG